MGVATRDLGVTEARLLRWITIVNPRNSAPVDNGGCGDIGRDMDATGKKAKEAQPLTVENVAAVFSRLRDLTQLSQFDALRIPSEHCHSAESAAQWWLEHGKERTWRRLIWVLDKMIETSVADNILHCAEHPTDPSFTVDRVMAVFEKLKEWRELFGSDSNYCIPRSRWAVISRDFADEQRQRQQAGLYYHHYYPNASWNDLAVALYKKGEREVLELIKPHLDNVKDDTLTEVNVMGAFTGVRLWGRDRSYYDLQMPRSTYDDIVGCHPGGEEGAKRSLVSEFLNHHPLPSWNHIVTLLRSLERDRGAFGGLSSRGGLALRGRGASRRTAIELLRGLEWDSGAKGTADMVSKKYLKKTPKQAAGAQRHATAPEKKTGSKSSSSSLPNTEHKVRMASVLPHAAGKEQILQDSAQATASVSTQESTSKLDQQPTLPELLRFHSKAQGCIISIIDEIGADYQLFGILLLKDKTGARVRALIKQNHEACDAINLEIVERWLQGGGEPVSWRILIGILKDVNLTVLAQDITDTLSEA